jgi:8-oxo-dGTP pyrophosphatase MutT (NUDIX family)
MEYDESFREAAIREIKEEVGLTIIPKGIIMENKNIPIITFEGSMFCDL